MFDLSPPQEVTAFFCHMQHVASFVGVVLCVLCNQTNQSLKPTTRNISSMILCAVSHLSCVLSVTL